MILSSNRRPEPDRALGLGLRSVHFNHILTHRPAVDWFEIISENFMDSGGRPRHVLRQIAADYPIAMHGVSLNIGSTDPLDKHYLGRLKSLIEEIDPFVVSDHLCWTGCLSLNSHDLLPLPLTEKALDHVTRRVDQVQDFLGRPIALENPSTYMRFKQSDIEEWTFFTELTRRSGCQMLLDVNNVYVSAFNNDFDAQTYIDGLPHQSIVQMHLAGHQHCGNYIIDTHDSAVVNPVWRLFHRAWQLTGGIPACLEWDGDIPDFEQYHGHILKAKDYMNHQPPAVDIGQSDNSDDLDVVATPLDFMVSPIQLESV